MHPSLQPRTQHRQRSTSATPGPAAAAKHPLGSQKLTCECRIGHPTSCDLAIFVDQPTEPVATLEAKLGRCRGGWEWPEWCCLVQCAVGAMAVEMRHVLGEHSLEVAAVEDQYPVQQFSPDGADPSFGDRVPRGARTGVRRMRMPSLVKTASKTPGHCQLVRSGAPRKSFSAWLRRDGRSCRVVQAAVVRPVTSFQVLKRLAISLRYSSAWSR